MLIHYLQVMMYMSLYNCKMTMLTVLKLGITFMKKTPCISSLAVSAFQNIMCLAVDTKNTADNFKHNLKLKLSYKKNNQVTDCCRHLNNNIMFSANRTEFLICICFSIF